VSTPIYLDHAATTPVASEVLEAMLPWLGPEGYGNPSSLHSVGRRARSAVDEARDRTAAALGCAAREVVFTAGGSEADNLALRGVLDRFGSSRGRHVVISAIEHDAVLKTVEQLVEEGRCEATVVGCDARGCIDPSEVAGAVRDDTVLVSVMLANNEVGTVQDMAGIVELVRARNPRTLIHTDAVQALGKLPLSAHELGVDLLSVSGHKVYGPKGVGALYVRQGVTLAPQISGGGHERGRRSGTENVPGIVGFGLAATLVTLERDDEMARLRTLSERLTETVATGVPDAVLTAAGAPRLASFATFAFPGLSTEVLLTLLDSWDVCASGGSACSSGAHMPSHVLVGMGLPRPLAAGALRCTLGRATTPDEVDRAGDLIVKAVKQLQGAATAAHG
jgi:cysteine desulfurase